MRKVSKYFLLILISFCAGISGAFTFYKYLNEFPIYVEKAQPAYHSLNTAMPNMLMSNASNAGVDFIHASEVATPAVVYIKVLSISNQRSPFSNPFFDFFGTVGPVSSSGSGVIISPDGYIVTNAHVVNNAEKIEIVMNNNQRTFSAKVIGIDGSSDLALLKIEGNNLPYLTFSNSDELSIGQWVAAVGNPFNLTSTVTAGIVSARGRNINIIHDQFPIESFIQTDAAINPGNSGGALVNLDGNLVGINSAILSKTGSYAGYGFAIPSNIVKKVISDLKEYGQVMRAFMEAEIKDISDINPQQSGELLGNSLNGVYVQNVIPSGNADKAGLKNGDLILKIDEKVVDSRAIFDEQLAYHRPGDKVNLVVKRGNKIFETPLILTNKQGTTTFEKSNAIYSKELNASFEEISKLEKEKYSIAGGIRVTNIGNGVMSRFNLQNGFIITALNGVSYDKAEDLIAALRTVSGRIQIQGINLDGSRGSYSFYSF